MPFDAGVVSAVCREISEKLIGGRVEKIYQPEREEIHLFFHPPYGQGNRSVCLSLNAAPDNSKISITTTQKQNPETPPSFCLFLRKHLGGGRLEAVEQLGFERAVKLTFSSKDEMGFPVKRYLVAETMGKYSNIIMLDGDERVISALRLIEMSMNSKRPVLIGMKYEDPPKQNKRNPLEETREGFYAIYSEDILPDKLIMQNYYGISPLISREIAHIARKNGGGREGLFSALSCVCDIIINGKFTPTLLLRDGGTPQDFSFMPIEQYGEEYETVIFPTFAELLDRFYFERDRAQNVQRRASDLLRVVSVHEARIQKKLELLSEDLSDGGNIEKYASLGELIISNVYQIKKGDRFVTLIDYSKEDMPEVKVELDIRLSPADNAGKYFRLSKKAKRKVEHAKEQIEISKKELDYILSVKDALSRAQGESELYEIREELSLGGYVKENKRAGSKRIIKKNKPAEFVTSSGLKVLCGKNNIQNEQLTFKTANKTDIWFHAKNMPGSHVILFTEGTEPTERDYTEAAVIAACHSSAQGRGTVEVDYTQVKNIKKPAGAKPGFVIYHTNYSALVLRDEELCESLSKR